MPPRFPNSLIGLHKTYFAERVALLMVRCLPWKRQSGTKRWRPVEPRYKPRRRGRPRTVPLRAFDVVPRPLIEAAKRMFAENWPGFTGAVV